MKKKDPPIIVEHFFHTTSDVLWGALTDLDMMKKWYFANIPEFKPEIGFETNFIVQSGESLFPHFWKITEVIPGKKISYDWRYEGYNGHSNVSFEIIVENKGCTLKVTTIVLSDFESDIPEFTTESCRGGWNYFIKESLANYLSEH